MKKVIVTLVAVGLVAGGFFQPVFAQDKKVEFGLNLGFMTDSFEEFLIALSPQVDIHVTKGFMISPEVMIATEFPIYGALLFPLGLFVIGLAAGAVMGSDAPEAKKIRLFLMAVSFYKWGWTWAAGLTAGLSLDGLFSSRGGK